MKLAEQSQEQIWLAWIKALESGKYQRASDVLNAGQNKMCCLGVLCDILDPDCWRSSNLEPAYDEDEGLAIYSYKDSSAESLPEEIQKLTGLDDLGFHAEIEPGEFEALTIINDGSEAPDFRDVLPHIKAEFQRRFGHEA